MPHLVAEGAEESSSSEEFEKDAKKGDAKKKRG